MIQDFTYNNKGLKICRTVYKHPEVKRVTTYQYDDKGNVVGTEERNTKGKLNSTASQYNNEGKIIEYKLAFGDDKITSLSRYKYVYNATGMSKLDMIYRGDSLRITIQEDFDDRGNSISRSTIQNGVEIYRSDIKFYNEQNQLVRVNHPALNSETQKLTDGSNYYDLYNYDTQGNRVSKNTWFKGKLAEVTIWKYTKFSNDK